MQACFPTHEQNIHGFQIENGEQTGTTFERASFLFFYSGQIEDEIWGFWGVRLDI